MDTAAVPDSRRAVPERMHGTMTDIFTVLKSLKIPQPTVVFEIGAGDGRDSLAIMNAIGQCEYHAFEPDPRNVKSIARSEVYGKSNFHLYECAIADVPGYAVLTASNGTNDSVGRNHTFSSSLKRPIKHLERYPWCVFDRFFYIEMMTLDQIVAMKGINEIGFIWCDVQGAEDLVIAGGNEALKRTRYFYTEYYQDEMYEGQIPCEEIHRRLPGKWEIVERWPEDVLFKNVS